MFCIRVLHIILAGSLSMGLLALPARAASEVVVHSFQGSPNDGANPQAGLIDVGGTLYGTTNSGGAHGSGTVFKVTTAGVVTMLHSFGHGHDGAYPQAGLINVEGTLYGTTSSGGAHGSGTVFSITTGGVEAVLHSFGHGHDGAYPQANLINVGGTLYGTTAEGGTGKCSNGESITGCGTVFKVTTAGVETALYSFRGGNDGANPLAGLIDVGGTLYGTTVGGGTNGCGGGGCGTVFKVTTAGVEKVLHSFQGGTDGLEPKASLVNVGGTLYGTTFYGGNGGPCCGTVFKITTAGAKTVLHSFQGGSDGENPQTGLINVGGTLYGTTNIGGTGNCNGQDPGCGTVFKITTAGAETVLYSFLGGSDGENPQAGLINVGGTLYGTTANGGASGNGTVFKITPQ